LVMPLKSDVKLDRTDIGFSSFCQFGLLSLKTRGRAFYCPQIVARANCS